MAGSDSALERRSHPRFGNVPLTWCGCTSWGGLGTVALARPGSASSLLFLLAFLRGTRDLASSLAARSPPIGMPSNFAVDPPMGNVSAHLENDCFHGQEGGWLLATQQPGTDWVVLLVVAALLALLTLAILLRAGIGAGRFLGQAVKGGWKFWKAYQKQKRAQVLLELQLAAQEAAKEESQYIPIVINDLMFC